MDTLCGDTTVVLSHPKDYFEIVSLEEWYKRFSKNPSEEYRVFQHGKFVRAIPVEEMAVKEPIVTVRVYPTEFKDVYEFKCSRNKTIFRSAITAMFPIRTLVTRFQTNRFENIPFDRVFLTRKMVNPGLMNVGTDFSAIEIIDKEEYAYPPTKLYTVRITEYADKKIFLNWQQSVVARNFTLGNGLILPGELELNDKE
jgi:hypothetical protein